MLQSILALNKLGKVDITFICVFAGIIVAIVAIYFLIPVFRKAQYQQQIDNLRAREAAIKAAKEGITLDENPADVVDDNDVLVCEEIVDEQASAEEQEEIVSDDNANDNGEIAE